MRYELKSISSWSYIKVMFFVNLIVGFVLGIFTGIFSGAFITIAAGLMFFSEDAIDIDSGFPIVIYIFAMGIMFSLGNAVFGTLFGAIIAGFYNLIVRLTGGLEFELQPLENIQAAAPAQQSVAAEPLKPKYVVPPPPPPPPVSGTAEPAKAETDSRTDSAPAPFSPPAPPPPAPSAAVPEPPPASKEAEKDKNNDNERFKPPDYLSNE